MEDFHLFGKLPVELRLLIWEWALRLEAEDRVVVLQREHVLLFRALRSSLLEVNSECREFALRRFYTLKMSVYQVAGFLRRYIEYGDSTSWTQIRSLFHDIEKCDNLRGTVFLSPDHDRFLISGDGGFEPFYQLEEEATFSGFNEELPEEIRWDAGEKALPIDHISGKLGRTECRSIRRLTVVELFEAETEPDLSSYEISEFYDRHFEVHRPHKYTKQEVERLWQTETFGGVRMYGHTWLEEGDHVLFLDYIFERNGRLPDWQRMDKLVWRRRHATSSDPGGKFLLNTTIREEIRRFEKDREERRRRRGPKYW